MRTCSLKFIDMSKQSTTIEKFTITGGILLLAGAAVRITGWEYSQYLYTLGALMFASAQFADRYDGDDLVMKRLRGQQVLGAFFLLITAVLMFIEPLHAGFYTAPGINEKVRSFLLAVTRRNSWIITLTISAVFELYSSFRMESRQKTLDDKGGF